MVKPRKPGESQFTPRELTIIQAVAHGHGQQATAQTLGISPHTVSVVLARIYRKLGFAGAGAMLKLAAWAARRGYSAAPAKPKGDEAA